MGFMLMYSINLHGHCLRHSHITVLLFSNLCTGSKINKCIEYQLLSLTYKVLTTTRPIYLHNLTSLQPSYNTCSSAVVTLAQPPPCSSLKITNHSFQCANKVPSDDCWFPTYVAKLPENTEKYLENTKFRPGQSFSSLQTLFSSCISKFLSTAGSQMFPDLQH